MWIPGNFSYWGRGWGQRVLVVSYAWRWGEHHDDKWVVIPLPIGDDTKLHSNILKAKVMDSCKGASLQRHQHSNSKISELVLDKTITRFLGMWRGILVGFSWTAMSLLSMSSTHCTCLCSWIQQLTAFENDLLWRLVSLFGLSALFQSIRLVKVFKVSKDIIKNVMQVQWRLATRERMSWR